MPNSNISCNLFSTKTHQFAVLTLCNAKNLNANTASMVRDFHIHLEKIAQNEQIAFIILRGEGERAFCAGGDVKAARSLILETDEDDASANQKSVLYFKEEYGLLDRLVSYPKPIVCFAGGYVMGGGAGLMQACSHRIVTETTIFSMPESLIGLFTDVGASYFLGTLPKPLGLFLAFTAAQLNAADLLDLDLADYALSQDSFSSLLAELQNSSFQSVNVNQELDNLLQNISKKASVSLQTGNALNALDELTSFVHDDFLELVNRLDNYSGHNAWIANACKHIAIASPTSLAIHWLYYQRYMPISLRGALKQDLRLVRHLCHPQSDFVEGVRARLIDKDFAPKWRWNWALIDWELVDSWFA